MTGQTTLMRRTGLALTLVVLSVAACSTQGERLESNTGATVSSDSPTTSEAEVVATEPESDDEIVSYLVEMANLAADLNTGLGMFEQEYNEEFWGVDFGSFDPIGAETEPPPEPSDEEMLLYHQGYWIGTFELMLTHADGMAALDPPPPFDGPHDAYIDAYRTYFTRLVNDIGALTSTQEFEDFLVFLFDPMMEAPGDYAALGMEMVEACAVLVDLAAQAGYSADLACPQPPPEAVLLEVEWDGTWSARPNPLAVGDGLISIRISNIGGETIRPVVVDIFEGDPLDLPVTDGVVDFSRSGEFDPASGYAVFGLSYAGEDAVFIDEFGVSGEPPELGPGDTVEAVIWSENVLVVFDYRRGAFEAGSHLVIERSAS